MFFLKKNVFLVAHIWQDQHNPMGVVKFYQWAQQQATNRSHMYEYGNLTFWHDENRSFFDFNVS